MKTNQLGLKLFWLVYISRYTNPSRPSHTSIPTGETVCFQAADPDGVQGVSETKLFHFHGIFRKNEIKSAKRTPHIYIFEPPFQKSCIPPGFLFLRE